MERKLASPVLNADWDKAYEPPCNTLFDTTSDIVSGGEVEIVAEENHRAG